MQIETSPRSSQRTPSRLSLPTSQTGGEFVLHHDGEPRTLTIIYYLNGVGGTWLPLADAPGSKGERGGRRGDLVLNNKDQALEATRGLVPGRDAERDTAVECAGARCL